MRAYRTAAALALIALGAGLAVSVPGCGKKAGSLLLPNIPPTVRLTSAPYSTTQRYYYSITLNWVGFDPDGRVDHYLFAIDPPSLAGSDTLWQTTSASQVTESFRSATPDTSVHAVVAMSDFHVFVVRAVDNRGALSPPVSRAFFSFTEAPTAQILLPTPNSSRRQYVTPAVRITWGGDDRDGVFTKKPVKWKFFLLTDQTAVTVAQARLNADAVRSYYAPLNWAGWDSTGADTTQKQYFNLVPDQEYIFCVVSFDEAGAYSPIFSLNNNMLYFRVTFAGNNNPKITLFNEFFEFTYRNGSYVPNNPAVEIPVEMPVATHASDRITFNWSAAPGNEGSVIRSYRWAVDIADPFDDTPRTDEDTDITHWSARSLLVTSCRVGPYFNNGETHRFYLECDDVNNLKSLGIVRFTMVRPTFAKPLAIVNDMRLQVDQFQLNTSCDNIVNRPRLKWPTEAELDTFLYAVGGVPWRCYPAGTITRPGLFHGYPFDTIGTRYGLDNMTTRLSVLGGYTHLIWILNAEAATNHKPGTDAFDPITSLRYMTQAGHANTLAAYIGFGGKVWMLGGGAPTATLYGRNNGTNDVITGLVFSNPAGELIPGRMVYDAFHWQSQFMTTTAFIQIVRELGRFRNSPGIYSALPSALLPKSLAAGDTFPPNRAINNGDFYQTLFTNEFLFDLPNEILEDADPTPAENFVSTLDTLFRAAGSTLPPLPDINATMTYYHGVPGQDVSLLLSGFNIWGYRKTQCKALVDFVLQQLWGITPALQTRSARAGRPAGDFASGLAPPWAPPSRGRVAPLPASPAPSARGRAAPLPAQPAPAAREGASNLERRNQPE